MVRTIFKQWETTIIQFKIPDFQSGTLDSLVQESEELNKIDHQLGSSVNKVVEILNSINPQTSSGSSSSSRIVQSRSIFDYIENFQWNSSKYRLDKPISQLVKMISQKHYFR